MERTIRIIHINAFDEIQDIWEIPFKQPVDGSLPKVVSRAINEFMIAATKTAGYVKVQLVPQTV